MENVAIDADNVGMEPPIDEPISPELALVAPDLGAAARRRLPDRPWEQFLTRDLRETDHRGVLPGPAARRPREGPARPRRRGPRRALAKVVLGVAIAAGIAHLGAWESGGEYLLEPPASRAEGAPGLLPYPRSAYLVHPRGRFRSGVEARAIGRFELPIDCGRGTVVVPRVPVKADGSFATVQRFPGVTVRLTGGFTSREHARGVVWLAGPGCPATATAFSASVS